MTYGGQAAGAGAFADSEGKLSGRGSGRIMQELDYTGAQGGMLAMAFAAGALFAFGCLAALGKFLWSIIGRVKDDEIARLKLDAKEDRDRCAAMETRLVQRIQQLEGIVLMTSPGDLRQDVQRALSEYRSESERARRASRPEGGA